MRGIWQGHGAQFGTEKRRRFESPPYVREVDRRRQYDSSPQHSKHNAMKTSNNRDSERERRLSESSATSNIAVEHQNVRKRKSPDDRNRDSMDIDSDSDGASNASKSTAKPQRQQQKPNRETMEPSTEKPEDTFVIDQIFRSHIKQIDKLIESEDWHKAEPRLFQLLTAQKKFYGDKNKQKTLLQRLLKVYYESDRFKETKVLADELLILCDQNLEADLQYLEDAWHFRGRACWNLEEKQDAINALQKAVELEQQREDNDGASLEAIISIYEQLGDEATAAQYKAFLMPDQDVSDSIDADIATQETIGQARRQASEQASGQTSMWKDEKRPKSSKHAESPLPQPARSTGQHAVRTLSKASPRGNPSTPSPENELSNEVKPAKPPSFQKQLTALIKEGNNLKLENCIKENKKRFREFERERPTLCLAACHCQRNHLKIFGTLIRHGANIHGETKRSQMRPLDIIANKEEEMFEVFKFLLDQNPAAIHTLKGAEALVFAAESGHLNIVRLLLPKMTRMTKVQRKALRTAVRYEQVDVAQAILEDGMANANPPSDEGPSLLTIANRNRQPKMIELLRRFGAKS